VSLPRFLTLAARLVFSAFFIIASIYCLLAYIPFTYQQVVAGGLFPWLTAFVRFFPFLYWVALAAAGLTLLPELRGPTTRNASIGFLAFFGLAGVVLTFRPLLPSLHNDSRSLVWSFLALLPLFFLAAIDMLSCRSELAWSGSIEGEEGRVFYVACASALLLAPLYAAIYFVRCSLGWATMPGGHAWSLSLQWTVGSHLLVFMMLVLILDFIIAFSRLFATPPKVEFLLSLALVLLVLWTTLRFVVFLPLSFTGNRATLVALVLAASLVAVIASLNLRMYRREDGPIESGLDLLIYPMRALRSASRINRLCFLLLIPGVAYLLAIEAAAMDWGFLLQKLTVILIWGLTLASLYTFIPAGRRTGRPALMYGMAVVILGGYITLLVGQRALLASSGGSGEGPKQFLGEYADFDISFRVAHDMLSGSPGGILTSSPAVDQFYSFLGENTDIPRSTRVEPVTVNLVSHLAPSGEPKPNIFIFVIDSLRRDYLSPYNSAVTFTPSVDSFGGESVVMENAFTQYGGTGLSEPCIWAGAVLLHQEYTTPFYPMNALEKLLETDQYRPYISDDNILRIILNPSFPRVRLDDGIGTMDLDLCRTARELTEKLDKRGNRGEPVFSYTQSQNIHISVVNREGRSVPPGEGYPGFDPAVASRLARIDKCFGEFIAYLKKSGLYDNSIIVLAADHGDSLGEGGRMGHAYTIFPEIVRVPLIIHLPPALKTSVWYDSKSVAFLTDITPTLYYLLGHRPIQRNGIYGRPLFTHEEGEQSQYLRDSYLMASSYGPVYGILRAGTVLYIADGLNYEDYLFDATAGPAGTDRHLDDAARADYRSRIVKNILSIDRYYGFTPSTVPR